MLVVPFNPIRYINTGVILMDSYGSEVLNGLTELKVRTTYQTLKVWYSNFSGFPVFVIQIKKCELQV